MIVIGKSLKDLSSNPDTPIFNSHEKNTNIIYDVFINPYNQDIYCSMAVSNDDYYGLIVKDHKASYGLFPKDGLVALGAIRMTEYSLPVSLDTFTQRLHIKVC